MLVGLIKNEIIIEGDEMKKLLLLLLIPIITIAEPMILKFVTVSDSQTIEIPLGTANEDKNNSEFTPNVTIDWGDGSNEHHTTNGNKTHVYAASGRYTVTITGELSHFGTSLFEYTSANRKALIEVVQWGDLGITNLSGAFQYCLNLTKVPPLPQMVTDLSYMFYHANSFNGNLSEWDVSKITNMSYMFWDCEVFNGNLSEWDVSSVTDMSGMFRNTEYFGMSTGGAYTPGDLSSWDVSNVTNMAAMFAGATRFNGDLSSWDVSNVTDMGSMFSYASIFNGDLSSWDVSNVTDMSGMFREAPNFKGDISRWNVSNVSDMSSMFYETSGFNGDLSEWDVSKVSNMSYMFYHAKSFNGKVDSWDISSITHMPNMFNGVSLTGEIYNSILIGWSTLDIGETQIPSNIHFDAGNSKYTSNGNNGRTVLVNDYNWVIIDEGFGNNTSITAGNTSSQPSISFNGMSLSFQKTLPYSVSIFSVQGRLLRNLSKSERIISLDKLGLASGVYQLRVVQGADVFTEQFMLK